MRSVFGLLVLVINLGSCQKSGGNGTGVVSVDTTNKYPQGSSDGDNEIAILALSTDAGPCNQGKRGKAYYVLQTKKFQVCSDSDAWEEVDLKGASGSAGANGQTSLVSVVSEPSGANCVGGGQKIISGLDTNSNGQLDAGEVSSNAYSCHGAAGSNGSAGTSGQTSLVAVTVESSGANCAAGGRKVQTGLDANANSTLDAGEVQSTSYVCNGAQGVVGANGASGKNSLIKITTESAGANCAFGGKKLEVGTDTNSSGVLDSGEVSSFSYVCDGSSLKLKKSDGTVVGQIISIFSMTRLDMGTQRNANYMVMLVKSSSNNAYTAYLAGKSVVTASSWNGSLYVPALDDASSTGSLKMIDMSFWGQTTFYDNYHQVHYISGDCTGQGYIVKTYGNSYQPDGDVLLFGTLPSFTVKYDSSRVLIMNQSSTNWSSKTFASLGSVDSCQTVSTTQVSSPVQTLATAASEWPTSIPAGWTIAP